MLPGRGKLAALLRWRTPRGLASYWKFDGVLCETAGEEAVLASKQKYCARWIGTSRDLSPLIISGQRNALYAQQSRGVTAAAVTSASASSSATGDGKWRFSMIFLFLPCLATFGLGSWQLIRRQKKIEMLDYRRKRLEEEPVHIAQIIDVANPRSESTGDTADGLEYRKVVCEGVYDVRKSLYVGPRARSDYGVTQKGYYLITPLMGVHGDKSVQVPVLVNRGWVPSGYKGELPVNTETFRYIPTVDAGISDVQQGYWWNPWSWRSKSNKKDDEATQKHEATEKICGVIRGSEQPNMFVPPNAPDSGQWFYVDVPSMARAVGLPEDTILIEAVQDKENIKGVDKYPIPKNPEALLHASVMPQDHINYALTWYTLSAATTYMAIKRVRNSRRGL